MVKENIIAKVTEPKDWVSNMLLSRSPNQINYEYVWILHS